MSFLRRTVALLAIALLTSVGAGELWSIEIDAIDGRPWDSGSVEYNSNPKERPLFKKVPNFRVASPEFDATDRGRHEKPFDLFLRDLFTLLNP